MKFKPFDYYYPPQHCTIGHSSLSNYSLTIGIPNLVVFYTCSEFEEKQHINENIEMRTNKVISVIICSNKSTGFQWNEQAEISDTMVIKQASHGMAVKKSHGHAP